MNIFNYLRMALRHPFFVLTLICSISNSAICQPIPNYVQDAYAATQNLEIHLSRKLLQVSSSVSLKTHPIELLVDDYNDILELIIDEDVSLFDSYEDKKEDRLNQLDKIIDKNSPWYNLVKAEIKFHWAIVNFKFNNEITSAWNINQAHALIKQNQKKFPEFKPNLKTLGIFHIVVGALPDNYQWIMEKLGFVGDIDLGLKELKSCSTSKNIFQIESKILLTYINAHLFNKYESSIQEFEKKYAETNNLTLNYLLVSLYTNTNQTEKAIQLIESKKKTDNHPEFQFYHYKLGNCYFQKGEYQKAITELNYFVKYYKGKNYLKGAYHKLALAHYFIGDKKQQMKAFQMIDEVGWKVGDEDKYAQKFHDDEVWPNKHLAKARYYSDGGYYEPALLILKEGANSFNTKVDNLELNYRNARIYDLMKSYDKALSYYQKTIQISEIDNKLYFAPNSCLKAALIHMERENIEEAKKLLQQAIDYKNHEYENSIEMKAKSLLKKLENKN